MTKPVLSKPARESNIELLRIVSMFFVLILHADYLTLDVPSATDFHHNPANFLVRTLADSFCLCAVNVFVMISGWFGIRGSVRGFCKFAFQAIYFLAGTYIVFLIAGKAPFSWGNVAAGLGLCRVPWFVASYAVLYVLAPVLNGFVQSASRRQLGTTLLCFLPCRRCIPPSARGISSCWVIHRCH